MIYTVAARSAVLLAMLRFWAYRARREGKPIPRWQLHALPWAEGQMELREERDDWLGRTVRVARFFSQRGHDVFPRLIEAQLIYADVNRLVLNGIERDELTRRDQAQTWVLHTAARHPPMCSETSARADVPRPAAVAPDRAYEMLPP